VFDEVTKRERGRRAARRGAWILGATALQAAAVAILVVGSAALEKRITEGPLVPVEIVKAPPAPPGPPPPPPAPRRREVARKPKLEAKPRPATVQPEDIPQEPKPPEPVEAPEEDYGDEDGVEAVEGGVVGGTVGGTVGGAVGGTVGGTPAPPPPPPEGPVKFDTTMTPPVLVSGPPLEYTQQALEREVEGTMVVECTVLVDGSVRACQVLKGLPFMDRAVVRNLERRRYRPATLGGKPLDVQYTFTIRLKLPQ
jgi:protein TonB